MFELGRWREPTPIFNGSGHSTRKNEARRHSQYRAHLRTIVRIGNPIDELLFTGAFPKQTRLLSHASRNNA